MEYCPDLTFPIPGLQIASRDNFDALHNYRHFSRFLPRIFLFAVMWHYTYERMRASVALDISSENEGIVINCSDSSDARAWIRVTNFSPFSIHLWFIDGQLLLAGRIAHFISAPNVEIKPSSSETIFIEADITGSQVALVKRMRHRDKPRLRLRALFNSSVRNFEVSGCEIASTNIEFFNCGDSE